MKRQVRGPVYVGADVRGFGLCVIEPDAGLRDRLAALVDEELAAVRTYADVDELLDDEETSATSVMVFGPSFANEKGLGTLQTLLDANPDFSAILAAPRLSTALLQHALRAGMRDVVRFVVRDREGSSVAGSEAQAQQFREAVDRVARTITIEPARSSDRRSGGEPARVITVASPKGGTGKSVIATNLAILLAQRSSRPVVLVDADLQFGDVAVLLRMAPEHTVVDAAQSTHRLDEDMLRAILIRHDASGLYVLPAPIDPALADEVSPGDLIKIIEMLQGFCSFVVIDTPGHFNDVTLSVLEHSDDVVLVAGMDIPSIKNVKLGLQTMQLLSISARLRLVLNRANSRVKLDVSEVLRTLQLKADCLIPSDIVVPQSVNQGIPAVISSPKSGVTKALGQLADIFLKANASSPSRRSAR